MTIKDFKKLTAEYQHITIIKNIDEQENYILYDGKIKNIPATIEHYKIIKIVSNIMINFNGSLDSTIGIMV